MMEVKLEMAIYFDTKYNVYQDIFYNHLIWKMYKGVKYFV